MKNVRLWAIMCTISNLIAQISAMLKPYSMQHYKVNIYYTIVSLTVILMIGLSLKEGNYLRLIFPAMMLTHLRNLIRLLDFE